MSKTYRVVCIGCSRMGSWFDDLQRQRDDNDPWSKEWVPGAMASVCQAIDRVELVACCDLDRELAERMQRRWDIPAAYTDYLEMIEQERPDIVAIVTSYGSTHAALAAGVAETGLVKGIYCEKPIATSMAEADRIIAACRTHGVAYSCSHVARWNVRYRQALEWIQEGAIGEVRAITCSAMGTLLHLGTHQTDALAGFAGDVDPEWASGVVDVPADLPQDQWPTMDPTGGGYIMMRNGVHLLMEGASPWPRAFQISGSDGKIQIWNDLHHIQLWQRTSSRSAVLEPGPLLSPPTEQSFAVAQMAELVQVLDAGGTTSCDEVRAARALEMVLGLHLSHQQGGARVSFPLENRTFGVDTK